MKHFVKIPNAIFDLDLETSELLIYAYLQSFKTQHLFIKQTTVAKKLGYKSTKTVAKALCGLEDKGLLKTRIHIKDNARITNSYTVAKLPIIKSFFFVPTSFFTSSIKQSSKLIYLFFLKCKNSNHQAFPSYSGFMSALSLSKQTVINGIKELIAENFLVKEHQMKRDFSLGHNLYTLHEEYVEKEEINKNTVTKGEVGPNGIDKVVKTLAEKLSETIYILFQFLDKGG